jgi:hypothetical protein
MRDRSYIIYIAFIALMAIMLFSCKTKPPVGSDVPIQYRERIVERLVPKIIPADSSALFALFECDSDKQVILKQLREMKGKAQSNIDFQNGKLTYKLIYKHDTVWVKADTVFISKEIPLRVEVPVEVNKLTQWQILQIWAGRFLLVVAGLYFVVMLLKRYLKLKI